MDAPTRRPEVGPPRRYTLDRGFDRVPKRPLSFHSGVKALGPFQERFAFFTVAPLYLWGRLHDRVLADFVAHQGGAVDFFHKKFDRPIFSGLLAPNGDADWNHVLWAVERPHWQPLIQHLCTAVLTDAARNLVYRYGLQELEILDPLHVDRGILSAVPPVLPIGAFGVLSNYFTAGFESERKIWDLPQMTFSEPDERCKLYARATCRQDPLAAVLTQEASHAATPYLQHPRPLSS